MSTFAELLIEFIGALRAAGVRISVAESIDATRAIAAAGLARSRMREALAATLIKDEADRAAFDTVFASFFAIPPADSPSRGAGTSFTGLSGGRGGESAGVAAPRTPQPAQPRESVRPVKGEKPAPDEVSEAARETPPTEVQGAAESARRGQNDAETEPMAGGIPQSRSDDATGDPVSSPDGDSGPGASAPKASAATRLERMREAACVPFSRYSELEYEAARDALGRLVRRLRVRVSRRLRIARAGRLDFRRTIRAALQRGGTFIDLRHRARRPRHVDLLILADVSGSVKYASALIMELAAGAAGCFRRVRCFAFIDKVAEAGFEAGHVVMAPPLDLYARSDFGRVLTEIWGRRAELLSRATLLVIMGDGRNNRRPARADLLREMKRVCRAVVWLNPESEARWGTGDSAIFQYERVVDGLYRCDNLRELARALERAS